MSEGRTSWCTPPDIVAAVYEAFGGPPALDPCSNEHATVGAGTEYRLPDHDGLVESWCFPTIFVNPPYGFDRERGTRIGDWLRRCVEASTNGSEVIALVPVSPNTTHWKRHVFPHAARVCFLSAPRVKFHMDGAEDRKGAPMACAVLYYGHRPRSFTAAFRDLGAVVSLRGIVLPRR